MALMFLVLILRIVKCKNSLCLWGAGRETGDYAPVLLSPFSCALHVKINIIAKREATSAPSELGGYFTNSCQ